MDTKPQVVYIAGYGRSGSTLLDSLLGNHPQVFGAGEVNRVFRRLHLNEPCACGSTMRDCAFWTAVVDRISETLPEFDVAKAAEVTLAAETLFSIRRSPSHYAEIWSAVLNAIGAVSQRSIIIDSSKNSRIAHYRLSLLRKSVGASVKVVHLVRDPRAVIWSTRRGSDRRLEQGDSRPSPGGSLRTLLSWTYSNIAAEAAQFRAEPEKFLRLRYEDLAVAPRETLASLAAFLEIDTGAVWSSDDDFDPGHGVGGNRMRRKGRIVIRYDDEWKRKLPRLDRVMPGLFFPLMRKYGYR